MAALKSIFWKRNRAETPILHLLSDVVYLFSQLSTCFAQLKSLVSATSHSDEGGLGELDLIVDLTE